MKLLESRVILVFFCLSIFVQAESSPVTDTLSRQNTGNTMPDSSSFPDTLSAISNLNENEPSSDSTSRDSSTAQLNTLSDSSTSYDSTEAVWDSGS